MSLFSFLGDIFKNSSAGSAMDMAKTGITDEKAAGFLKQMMKDQPQPMAQAAPANQAYSQSTDIGGFSVPPITLLEEIPNWNLMKYKKLQQQ